MRGIVLLSMLLTACIDKPPTFAIEDDRASAVHDEASRSFSIGSLVTPPPGTYRFVRMHADGRADVRELVTFNGPGPWLAYVGQAAVPSVVVLDAFATIDASRPAQIPDSGGAPCVIAFDIAGGGEWQGCAHQGLAQRVLSLIPSLAAPDAPADCNAAICDVRILRESPFRHEHTAGLVHDSVVSITGQFWCAKPSDEQHGQATTLHVARGNISRPDASRVFQWLTAGVQYPPTDADSVSGQDSVMVRKRGSHWIRVRPSRGAVIVNRWHRLARLLPSECRSGE